MSAVGLRCARYSGAVVLRLAAGGGNRSKRLVILEAGVYATNSCRTVGGAFQVCISTGVHGAGLMV